MSALVAGSVTVAADESATGSGYALALYSADIATATLPTLPTLGNTAAPYSSDRPVQQSDIDVLKTARVALLQEAARRATAYASGTVSYFQSKGIGT